MNQGKHASLELRFHKHTNNKIKQGRFPRQGLRVLKKTTKNKKNQDVIQGKYASLGLRVLVYNGDTGTHSEKSLSVQTDFVALCSKYTRALHF